MAMLNLQCFPVQLSMFTVVSCCIADPLRFLNLCGLFKFKLNKETVMYREQWWLRSGK